MLDNIKDFVRGYFYDTEELEQMEKEDIIFIVECLQSQLSEAQRILRIVKHGALEYNEVESNRKLLRYIKRKQNK
jgi:hypothetical protein